MRAARLGRETLARHPARFTDAILVAIEAALAKCWGDESGRRVLDPFAGTGRVHQVSDSGDSRGQTVGVELEPEWATMHPRNLVGNVLALPFAAASFDAIVTSPCYANRMADHHQARDASVRHTYRHSLGRPLHPDNAGQLQWGTAYRNLHTAAWAEAIRVLRPGGLFLLNCSDHIRKGVVVPVTAWHIECLVALGMRWEGREVIPTPRLRHGANGSARVDYETLDTLRKPLDTQPVTVL